MTLSDLRLEVSALGFDTASEGDAVLIAAANRAHREIFSDIRPLGKFTFYARKTEPSSLTDELSFRGGEEISLPLSGRAFSMHVSGKGRYSVRDSLGSQSEDFDTHGALVRGFINGNATLTLSGSYSFKVTRLATYSEVYSAELSDIPDGTAQKVYDLRRMIPDYSSFSSLPTDADGNEISSAELSDGTLTLPKDYSGTVRVRYVRLPKRIASEGDTEIDIPEEYSHLLPLLTASYVWLDREPEWAAHYRELYRYSIDRIRKDSVTTLTTRYRDINGWA